VNPHAVAATANSTMHFNICLPDIPSWALGVDFVSQKVALGVSWSLRWESGEVNGTCEARRASSRCLDGGMVRAFVAHSSVGLTSSCTVCWHRC
jgi:hypothetical protein